MRPKMAICRKYLPNAAKNGMPTGAAIMNGIVASIVVVIAPILPNQDLFWAFFSLNLVMFLLSYVPVFPAFYKLRKIDPDTPRPFKVSGSDLFLKVLVALPMIMIVISLIFTALPLQFDAESLSQQLPITIGAIVFALVGEAIIWIKKSKRRSAVSWRNESKRPHRNKTGLECPESLNHKRKYG